MIQYPYALNSDGILVSANAAEKHENFFCVTCGGKMYLAGGDGKQMRAHFRHESDVEHPGETFLHDYTKRYFAQLIEQSDCFRIGFDIEERCCKEICRFDRRNCKRWVHVRWDLKERKYDKVEIEKPYGDFQPDVLLTSSKYPDAPIFIEIEVTNPCSEEKLRSGYRIIEITMPRDYDVTLYPLDFDSLIEGGCGNGIHMKFYNFKHRQRESEAPLEEKDIRVIVLKENGKVYMSDSIACSNYGTKIFDDSVVEVHFAREFFDKTPVTAYKAVAVLYGIPYDNCRMCSVQKYEIGRYKKRLKCSFDNEEIKYGDRAKNCPEYSFSRIEALRWASRVDESSYIVVDKNGNYVFPVFVKEELEKKQ
jgi:hypothetical protein